MRELNFIDELDLSIFEGEDNKWVWAAEDREGSVHLYSRKPFTGWSMWLGGGYSKLVANTKHRSSYWEMSLLRRVYS